MRATQLSAAFAGFDETLLLTKDSMPDSICDLTLPRVSMKKLTESNAILAPVLALDLGEKRIGVAVSDAMSISIRSLGALRRTSWKRLLLDVENVIRRFDARTVVIGFPLQLNGSRGESAIEARRVAAKFAQSLKLPVYLQDERLTSFEAEQTLRSAGHKARQVAARLDGEAAAVILRDFLVASGDRMLVPGVNDVVETPGELT